MSVTASGTDPSATRSFASMLSAVEVGNIPFAWRMNSSSRKSARNLVNAWLTAGWVIASLSAARDKLCSS